MLTVHLRVSHARCARAPSTPSRHAGGRCAIPRNAPRRPHSRPCVSAHPCPPRRPTLPQTLSAMMHRRQSPATLRRGRLGDVGQRRPRPPAATPPMGACVWWDFSGGVLGGLPRRLRRGLARRAGRGLPRRLARRLRRGLPRRAATSGASSVGATVATWVAAREGCATSGASSVGTGAATWGGWSVDATAVPGGCLLRRLARRLRGRLLGRLARRLARR